MSNSYFWSFLRICECWWTPKPSQTTPKPSQTIPDNVFLHLRIPATLRKILNSENSRKIPGKFPELVIFGHFWSFLGILGCLWTSKPSQTTPKRSQTIPDDVFLHLGIPATFRKIHEFRKFRKFPGKFQEIPELIIFGHFGNF